eukprot:GHVS01050462.1.p1 GENE.GHVS01050462.1~~GHVS01050462.1.p1  ORF type:complete len:104 (-),score=28.23 GHVS01050462.1:71-382(-)
MEYPNRECKQKIGLRWCSCGVCDIWMASTVSDSQHRDGKQGSSSDRQMETQEQNIKNLKCSWNWKGGEGGTDTALTRRGEKEEEQLILQTTNLMHHKHNYYYS